MDFMLPLTVDREASYTQTLIVCSSRRPDNCSQPYFSDGALVSGSSLLKTTSTQFTDADIGLRVYIPQGAAGRLDLYSSIVSRQTANQVTLADNSGMTLANAAFCLYSPLDLTGATADLQIRSFLNDATIAAELTSSAGISINVTNSTVAFTFTVSTWTAVPAGNYNYDLKLTQGGTPIFVIPPSPLYLREDSTR